jgi:methionyl-tRNA formyltransferase
VHPLDREIAFISINPGGRFMRSAQAGFAACGLHPRYLIHVSPGNRVLREFRKYRLRVVTEVLLPKFRQHAGNRQSFSNESVDIPIPERHRVRELNSSTTAELIRRLGIRYLVNGGAGIFRAPVLEIPNLMVINAHAGDLPRYRNMNVVEWTLYNREPVIGTIHQIDGGIDTGPVILREEIDVKTAHTLDEARQLAYDGVIRMAGRAVLGLSTGELVPQRQPRQGGRNWYRMHARFQEATDLRLKNRG